MARSRDEGPEGDDPLQIAAQQRDRKVLDMVRAALTRRDAMLAFQPVMQARRRGQVAFYEGLIRLCDESGRVIPAGDFIDAVETLELGRQIDCLALELGLAELAANPGLRLSINMSARSIGYPRWRQVLERALADAPTVGERLILEITETSAMVMPEIVGVFMAELQAKGISFALDDFGAGCTAFRHFRDFYFDVLKIDSQFCRDVATSTDNQVLVQALTSLGQHFGMLIVAEGVETAEDAVFLTAAGIDCLQGYHFGAPELMPPWRREAAARIA